MQPREGPLRILFFSDHFRPEPSAPAAHVYDRALAWVREGHDVTVITSAPNFPEGAVHAGYRNWPRSVERMNGIRVVRVGTFVTKNEGVVLRSLDYLSYMVSAFFFSFFERRPDVMISTSPHLFAAVAGAMAAWVRRVPHVMEIRDLWPASIRAATSLRLGRLYRVLEGVELGVYRHSARVLSFTRSYVDDLVRRGVPRDKIDVVLNAADLDLFSPREPEQAIAARYGLEGRFVVGYLGTIGLAHGLENVLAAAETLRDAPVSFFFVGVGAAKEALQERARRMSLDHVHFAPRQPKEAMPRFWSVCDVGLVHLKDDPVFATVIPSKIFESMAMGRPVLFVGPEGEGSTIVRDHDVGVTVPPADPVALGAAIRGLIEDERGRARMAENAVAAAPRYSRGRQAAETLAVLRRAAGRTE